MKTNPAQYILDKRKNAASLAESKAAKSGTDTVVAEKLNRLLELSKKVFGEEGNA